MSIRINPSILAADFANLEAEFRRISQADAAHVDVMDNHFVPNLTLGQPIVHRLNSLGILPLDLHLMITDADRWAPEFAELGVYSTTFHAEASTDPIALARRIRAIGSRAGVAVKPATPVTELIDNLHEFDQLLVMTVEPGFGGQKFMDSTMPKLRTVAEAARRQGVELSIQVDGGINEQTIDVAAAAGATTFVAGSSVFGAANAGEQIDLLRERARAHTHSH